MKHVMRFLGFTFLASPVIFLATATPYSLHGNVTMIWHNLWTHWPHNMGAGVIAGGLATLVLWYVDRVIPINE